MGHIGRRVPSLLASRRLHDNPASGFRAISGLVLAVFVASLVSALAASAVATVGFHRSPISPTTVGLVANAQVAVGEFQREVADIDAGGLDPTAATTLLRDVDGIAGVRRVVDVRALPAGVTAAPPGAAPQDFGPPLAVGVVDCEGAGALKMTTCAGTTGVDVTGGVTGNQLSILPLSRPVPRASLEALPLLGVAAFTDGRDATIERVRTQLEIAFPQAQALTGRDIYAEENWQVRDTLRLTHIALVVTLLIAGCSLAVSVAGGLVERKRPFALLRLAGMPLRQLHRVVFAEAAAPLLVVSAVSVALGFAVDAILVTIIGGDVAFRLPTLDYWIALATGLTLALVIVCATLPLLDRLTSLESARFE
jgi:hypothetical protein